MKQDISFLLKVCPSCLGDLVTRSAESGVYYLCIQCNEEVYPRKKRLALPLPRLATQPGDFFPEPEISLTMR